MNIGIMADAHIGLCEGRHEIKTNEGDLVDSYIFGVVDNPMDFMGHFHKAQEFFTDLVNIDAPYDIFLYVTGLTSLLTASLLAASKSSVASLILMHYDRESGNYIPQDITPLL